MKKVLIIFLCFTFIITFSSTSNVEARPIEGIEDGGDPPPTCVAPKILVNGSCVYPNSNTYTYDLSFQFRLPLTGYTYPAYNMYRYDPLVSPQKDALIWVNQFDEQDANNLMFNGYNGTTLSWEYYNENCTNSVYGGTTQNQLCLNYYELKDEPIVSKMLIYYDITVSGGQYVANSIDGYIKDINDDILREKLLKKVVVVGTSVATGLVVGPTAATVARISGNALSYVTSSKDNASPILCDIGDTLGNNQYYNSNECVDTIHNIDTGDYTLIILEHMGFEMELIDPQFGVYEPQYKVVGYSYHLVANKDYVQYYTTNELFFGDYNYGTYSTYYGYESSFKSQLNEMLKTFTE